MKFFICLIGVSLLCLVGGQDSLLVQTDTGKVRGKLTTLEGIGVRQYLGIPYAKAPVGKLRFRPPLPAEPWEGVLEATDMPNICHHVGIEVAEGLNAIFFSQKEESENCLFLNVLVPDEESETKRPVMVLVHGGSFQAGSADDPVHSPLAFAAIGKVIIVSMNYRLGILGFLNAGVPDAPGNMGFLDQNLALQWVKRNIENFGGDTSRITLYGDSAGSMGVSAHVLSPLSKGLFHRAMMLGGSIVNSGLLQSGQRNKAKANKAASILGCDKEGDLETNTDAVLECLRGKDVSELLSAQLDISPTWMDSLMPSYGDSFLPENPHAAENFFTVDVDLVTGVTTHEGSHFIYPKNYSLTFQEPDVNNVQEARRFALSSVQDIGIQLTEDDLGIYFEGMETASKMELLKAIIDIVGDVLFVCPVIRVAEQHAAHGNQVHLYVFGRNMAKKLYPDWAGVTHGTDFNFIHGITFVLRDMFTDEERDFSREMIKGFAHFVATGKMPTMEGVTWKLFNSPKQIHLLVNEDSLTLGIKPRSRFCESLRNKI